ncbi:unnamed protein product [Sphagnum tenellum]
MKKTFSYILGSLSGLYALVMVSFYVAFTYTELVTFPKYYHYLEKTGFFVYLYFTSDLFLFYVIWFTIRRGGISREGDVRIVENHKSHGSLPARFGAVVFGVGTIIYFILDLISFIEIHKDSPCYLRLQHGATAGTDHHQLHTRETSELLHPPPGCGDSLVSKLSEYWEHREECKNFTTDILGGAFARAAPYLYPFVIEYALIGASVMYLMWLHVGKMPTLQHLGSSKVEVGVIRKPKPLEFLRKGDWTHSWKGMLMGLVVFVLAVVNLGLFFGMAGQNTDQDLSEYYSKAVNTALNMIGITGVVMGFGQIQRLPSNPDFGLQLKAGDLLDMGLLRFTAFFSYLYHNFTVISGALGEQHAGFPSALHVINGVVEVAQITTQIIFIMELKKKVVPHEHREAKPGRQVTVFLFLLNMAQWIVISFEIQKMRASVAESKFFGFLPWIVIQRITLPLTVFFRFHSAVVSMELWKEIYWND